MPDRTALEKSLQEEEHGAFLEGVPGYLGALGCGITALTLATVSYIPDLKVMAMIDLPVGVVCLFASTFLALGSRRKSGLAIWGVIMAALGSILAAVHLLVDLQHPWYA